MHRWVALAIALGVAWITGAARGSCVPLPCKPNQIEAPDGKPLATDASGRPILRPGEPFVVRRGCLASCSAGGRPGGGPFDPQPHGPAYAQLGADGLPCGPSSHLRSTRTPDGAGHLVESGLSRGVYRVEDIQVAVGDPDETAVCAPPTTSALVVAGDVELPPPPQQYVTNLGPYAPPESVPTSYAEHWDDREGFVWEADAGFWLSAVGDGGAWRSVHPGGVVSVGLHSMVRWRASPYGQESLIPEIEAVRWCPLACLGVGLLVAPSGLFVGNELGVDLRAAIGAGVGEGASSVTRLTTRPFLRYAEGAFRTQSFVGAFVPEVGVQLEPGRKAAITVAWSLLPVDVRLAGPVALSIDPIRAGLLATPGGGMAVDLGGELTIGFAP